MMTLFEAEAHAHTVPTPWRLQSTPPQCISCNEVLDVKEAFHHVRLCVQAKAEATSKILFAEHIASLTLSPCTFVMSRRKVCGRKHHTPEECYKHLFQHYKSSEGHLQCKLESCKEEFDSGEALVEHCFDVHRIKLAHSANELYTFCRYCEDYVWEHAHTFARRLLFEQHFEEAKRCIEV